MTASDLPPSDAALGRILHDAADELGLVPPEIGSRELQFLRDRLRALGRFFAFRSDYASLSAIDQGRVAAYASELVRRTHDRS